MEPAATPSDQLISQTHRLSLSSLSSDTPSNAGPTPGMDAFSPAMAVATDAQPVDEMVPNSLQTALSICLESDALHVYQHFGNDNDGHSRGAASHVLLLEDLPNEVLSHILGFLDVCDLLSVSRVG